MNMEIDSMRTEYGFRQLDEKDIGDDPLRFFGKWFEEALHSGCPEPNAMTLATTMEDGRASARTVLLKGFDERGFVFFTHYESRKGRELAATPWACLVFWWPPLERQARIEGCVEKTSPEESDAYFRSRPEGARLVTWVTSQSRPIPDREVLEVRMKDLAEHYRDREIPRPPHWGGYRVIPKIYEFWQGRPNRLHDRLRFRLGEDDCWILERLSP
jgi:pyridoxamine 5'-phosphate oxidase